MFDMITKLWCLVTLAGLLALGLLWLATRKSKGEL